MIGKLPVNSIDPLHLAGDCFRDALIEIKLSEEEADQYRGIFICLKQTAFEDNRDRHICIASQQSQHFDLVEMSFKSVSDPDLLERSLIPKAAKKAQPGLSLSTPSAAAIPRLADHLRKSLSVQNFNLI